VQPRLLKGDEATRHIITVLSPQQAVEPFGKSADHRRRKHMRQLDEGITTEGFTLGSIKSVGGCEFHPQLLIVGGSTSGRPGPATSAIGASPFSASVTYQCHQS
jgi:hypothetical protein